MRSCPTAAYRRGGVALPAVLLLCGSLLGAGPTAEEEAATFAAVKTAVAANRLQKTSPIGGHGQVAFSETAGQPGVLVGFEFGLGKSFKLEVIYAVRAIYSTAEGTRRGPEHGLFTSPTAGKKRSKVTRVVAVQAKPGYAVSGVTGRAGLFLNGMALNFRRVDGTKLDAADGYQSDWIGDRTGGREISIDSRGMPVVGIHGKVGASDCQSLGLLFVSAAPEAAGTAVPVTRREAKAVEPAPRVKEVFRTRIQEEPVRPATPKAETAQQVAVPRTRLAAPEVRPQQANVPAWAVPTGVGLLVALMGVGGAVMFGAAKQPVAEAAGVPASVSASQPCVNLPAELDARMREELAEGEQLIWAGQPSPRATRFKILTSMATCLLLALLAGGGVTVGLAMMTNLEGGAWIPLLGFAVFVLLGLAGAVLAPATQKSLARRTCYAITNRRAVVCKPRLFGSDAVDSYGPVQLQQMVRRDWWMVEGAAT